MIQSMEFSRSEYWSGFSAPWASQVAPVVKNLPTNAEDIRDMGSIPASGRSPGGGHSNPPQYAYLGNPMDRGACWATVCGAAKESDATSD